MSMTCPACRNPKSRRFKLCKECYDLYGRDLSEWPPWVVFLVADDNRLEWQDKQIQQYEVTLSDLAPEVQDAIDDGYLPGAKIA